MGPYLFDLAFPANKDEQINRRSTIETQQYQQAVNFIAKGRIWRQETKRKAAQDGAKTPAEARAVIPADRYAQQRRKP